MQRKGINSGSRSTAQKTLGPMTCPMGNPTQALARMTEQAKSWVNKAIKSKLPRQSIWFMVSQQFWPQVGYGISCNTASLARLEEALWHPSFQLLPLGGFICSAPTELRVLNVGFGAIDCLHPGIECLVAQLNKLQMHYGCTSSLGATLQTSMELFVLKLGFSATHPFTPSYCKYASLVTDSWIKSIWEKCDHFGIEVTICNIHLQPPCKGDAWIMPTLVAAGHTPEQLESLNRVRIYQQVLFISDVLTASGRIIEGDRVS